MTPLTTLSIQSCPLEGSTYVSPWCGLFPSSQASGEVGGVFLFTDGETEAPKEPHLASGSPEDDANSGLSHLTALATTLHSHFTKTWAFYLI